MVHLSWMMGFSALMILGFTTLTLFTACNFSLIFSASENSERKKTQLNPVLGENIEDFEEFVHYLPNWNVRDRLVSPLLGSVLKHGVGIHQLFYDQRHRTAGNVLHGTKQEISLHKDVGTSVSCTAFTVWSQILSEMLDKKTILTASAICSIVFLHSCVQGKHVQEK